MQFGEKRQLALKEEGTEYAQVMRLLGNGRREDNCFDGYKRICAIRGKLRNRVWMNPGDIVLVSIREFGDDKGDVMHKFYPEEAYELQDLGEIPENIAINEGMPNEDEEKLEEDDLAIGAGDSEDGEEKEDNLDIDDL